MKKKLCPPNIEKFEEKNWSHRTLKKLKKKIGPTEH